MPKPELLPAEFAEDSLEAHLARRAGGGYPIYLAVVGVLLAGLAALPLVRVAVSVESPGIVRPVTERHEIVARTSGFVETVAVRGHQRVEAGQLLLRLRGGPLDARRALVDSQRVEREDERRELRLLATAPALDGVSPEALRTPRLRLALEALRGELDGLARLEERAGRELERARLLADRGLVPAREVEAGALELAQLQGNRALRAERARSAWHEELAAVEASLRELRARAAEVRLESSLHRVESPVAGTVEELAGLSPGSWVQAGTRLAVVSPGDGLVAEVFVASRDVGLLREGAPVRVHVDAFNHHDWGSLSGRVREIADDFVVHDGRPVFRVEVALDRTYLRLRDGARGELRKGMTLRARFRIAERTLLQLLRDDVSDWLAPAGAG